MSTGESTCSVCGKSYHKIVTKVFIQKSKTMQVHHAVPELRLPVLSFWIYQWTSRSYRHTERQTFTPTHTQTLWHMRTKALADKPQKSSSKWWHSTSKAVYWCNYTHNYLCNNYRYLHDWCSHIVKFYCVFIVCALISTYLSNQLEIFYNK